MNIGIVTTWFERGAAYISRAYLEALRDRHKVFIYARGGESYAIGDPKWDLPYVTWGRRLIGTYISTTDFDRWLADNSIEVLLFNEQQDWRIILHLRRRKPSILIGSYVDYYTESTIPWFRLFDFLICNTRRHVQAMRSHPQVYYVPWGVDTGLYKPSGARREQVVFFHSAGMSDRKGTELLIDAFVGGGLGKRSKLVIHTQRDLSWATKLSVRELSLLNVEVVNETVGAPGLYHLGDVYVYPTRLDGLGLTMYEALSCGMPVIATDYPPMSEVVDEVVGRLVRVSMNYCRSDAYYWPMSVCDRDDLLESMIWYLENPDMLEAQSRRARERALEAFDWGSRHELVCAIFEQAVKLPDDEKIAESVGQHYRMRALNARFGWMKEVLVKHPAGYNKLRNLLLPA